MNSCVVGENVTDFQLKWHILDAFAPWEAQENTFILFGPDPYIWHVKLRSLSLNANSRRFLCSLRYDTEFGPEATAESFEILITLNGTPVNRNMVFDYTFSRETRYLYSFEVEISAEDDCIVAILGILVHMNIRRRGIGGARALNNGTEIQLLTGGDSLHLDILSLELWESQVRADYSTLRMFSRENMEFLVHHYILQERWTNLFTVHNLDENSVFVNIDIPFLVLNEIVCYMYSGVVDTSGTMWNCIESVAEFLQVVRRYQITHLYEALRQGKERVSQTGRNYVDRRKIVFALHYVRNNHLGAVTVAFPIHVFPCNVNLHGSKSHNFLLSVHTKHHNRAGTWLSYSLRSQTEVPFRVHISLKLKGNENSTKLVNTSKYSISRDNIEESGPILFLGCPETFSQTECIERLVFELTFSDGISSANIWHLSKAREFMRNPKEILSQHMRNILERQFKTDLVVEPQGNLNGGGVQSHPIHKEIFNARLPGWRNVVVPRLPEGEPLPNTVTLALTNESFQHVVAYMYTGTTARIPLYLRPEIVRFATDAGVMMLGIIIHDLGA